MAYIDLAIPLTQTAILVVLIIAIKRYQIAAAVNAVAAFAAALTPWLIELTTPLNLPPVMTLWLGIAGLIHAIGMLGPYSSIAWWDYLTHTVSGAFVATVVYSALLVVTEPNAGWLVTGGTVGATVLVGIVWELLELVARSLAERHNIPPVLVVYSWRDTTIDLIVDGLAAVIVVALGLRPFVLVFEQIPQLPTLLIVGSGVSLGVSVILVALVLSRNATPGIEWT